MSSLQQANKTEYFEYFLLKVFSTKKESFNYIQNDFSILKSQKLLFLLTAVNSRLGGENILIEKVFNNFVAMPYGPVEIDIYNSMKDDELKIFEINSRGLKLKEGAIIPVDFPTLNLDLTSEIDNSVDELLNKNSKIFSLNATTLVEITHLYNSWKIKYSEARRSGAFKEVIPKELIIADNKYFHLNQFELI
jgi:uncharacterized phage-associated protein